MVTEEETRAIEEAEEVEGMFVGAARKLWATNDLEIDDAPEVSIGDNGAFVAAWVWVSNSDAGLYPEED